MRLRTTASERLDRTTLCAALALVGGLGALGCNFQNPDPFYRYSTATTLVRCEVSREECSVISSSGGTYTCATIDPGGNRAVTGDVCVEPTESGLTDPKNLCKQIFCTNDVNAPRNCEVVTAQVTAGSPACTPQTGNALVQLRNVQIHSVHPDVEHQFSAGLFPGVVVNGMLGTASDPPICVPPTKVPLSWAGPDLSDVSRTVRVLQAIPGSPDCTAPSDQIFFTLPPASMGMASGGGTTTNLSALRAHARVGRSCFDEICVLKTLDDFQADLADMTISGIQLRKLRILLVSPAPLTSITPPDSPPFLGVAPSALRLRVEGQMNGVDKQFHVTSASPFRVDAATSFRLLGNLDVSGPGPNGQALTVHVHVDANGAVATPQEVACATQSGLDRLFGFEDVGSWNSTQAELSLVTSPVTQGCGALGVRGQGFMPIVGVPFSTRGLSTNVALSVDLRIPSGQPNPFWLGALQMHLSCPSGAVNNQYIGQVELTGKPVNQYSTLRFPLPQAVRTTLARPLDDCSFTMSLNVNQTGNTWILDRLRFTQ